MTSTPIIRTFKPDEWRTYRDIRLRALGDAPDAFGSTLAREETLSDAQWAGRLQVGSDNRWNLPLLAEVCSEPVGLAWGRIERSNPERADLYQMWVHPENRCLGAGKLLLDAVVAWAMQTGARYLALGATCGDTPANRLYARATFKPIGEPQPLRSGSLVLGQEMHLQLRESAG